MLTVFSLVYNLLEFTLQFVLKKICLFFANNAFSLVLSVVAVIRCEVRLVR